MSFVKDIVSRKKKTDGRRDSGRGLPAPVMDSLTSETSILIKRPIRAGLKLKSLDMDNDESE